MPSKITSMLKTAIALSLLSFIFPHLTYANLPKSSNVPGGIAIVPLGRVLNNSINPQAWLGEQAILVTADHNQWYAVVGLPLGINIGSHTLKFQIAGKTRVRFFRVKAKKYPEQKITLKDTSKVELSSSDEARASREIFNIKQLKRHWREDDDTDLAFIIPAEGRLSGNFGLRRIFNGQPRSPHAGLDVAVARGTPIMASAQGEILAVDDYFFNGKTIFVDHGNGLITMYCHLDQSDVHTGDTVSKGQQLGLSGQTGRATGPHLHWSVVLNGAMVDPALFISGNN